MAIYVDVTYKDGCGMKIESNPVKNKQERDLLIKKVQLDKNYLRHSVCGH